jgi:predicted metalloprotease
MTRPAVARLLALLTAGAVAAACGLGGSGDDGGPVAGPPPASPNTTDDDDGTMTAEEFKDDIKGATDSAEGYWDARFKEAGERFVPVREIVAYSREGEVDCGGEPLPRNNAVYCPDGDFIAYDVNFAVAAFRQVGDAFLYYLLGHEYAHAIQARLGIEHRLTIDHELQADCMAGAYLGDSVDSNALKIADGDLEEFRSGLLAVGDDPSVPWFAPGAHGTAEQRTESFFEGYERSLSACDLG